MLLEFLIMPTSDEIRTDLALSRTVWALERTQLAWIRTGFAIIATGFALDKGTEALNAARLLREEGWVSTGRFGGILLSALAAILLIAATTTYHKRLVQMSQSHGYPLQAFDPLFILSWLVVVLGFGVAFLLLVVG